MRTHLVYFLNQSKCSSQLEKNLWKKCLPHGFFSNTIQIAPYFKAKQYLRVAFFPTKKYSQEVILTL